MACAQLKTMRNWNRSSSDVGDLVTTATNITKQPFRRFNNSEIFNEADVRLFNRVVSNPEHVLQQFLTERHQTYNLRRRPHGNKTLMEKTSSLNEQDFFVRAMYKHSY